jgi:hypothetical protein
MDRTAGTKDLGTRMLGNASWDRTAEIGQPDRTTERGQLEKGSQDFIGQDSRTRKRGQDARIMTARTGQLGQDNGDEQPC